MIRKKQKIYLFSMALAFSWLAFAAPVKADIMIPLTAVESGEVQVSTGFFEDRTASGSVIQAMAQFSRLRATNQLRPSNMIDLGTAGGSFWIELPITNNSHTDRWNLEFIPLTRTMPSPIKSVEIFDNEQPDAPLLRWPNLERDLTALSLPVTLPSIKTTTRYALVETWPGIQNPVMPVLKTAELVANETTSLAQKISLLWLITGAVCGAGLVQLILTRQMLQGMLAINALLVGSGIFVLQRSELIPALTNYHPLVLPLTVYSFLGIGASLMLWVASRRYSVKAAFSILPLALNLAFLFLGLFKFDILLAQNITLEKIPHIALSMTGIMLTLATVSITINQYGLAWFIPAWIALAAMPWIGDYLPFGAPIIYALMLALAGVASVFSHWKSMDQETEFLQKRLRHEMKELKDKYDDENMSWEKKMESERFLLNELRHREQQRSAELEIARREADTANKAKSDFLAIISHEIRTPMNGIMGVIDLIRQSPLNEKQQEYIEVIKNSGDTMLTLLNDILDYSKIEKGVIDLEEIPFNLRNLVNSVATLMSGRAKDKGLTIDVRVAEDIAENMIGDPNRIRQILLNLVGNAIKFTEKGNVAISVQRKPMQQNEYQGQIPLLFEIIDTGIGISKESQTKLFQAYVQADASISRRYGGTGLGLNICRMLVSAMKGDIGLVSSEGQGSTFWFVIPLAPASAAMAENGEHIVSKASRAMRVLLIDDNPINLKVTSGLLELDGHEVITANSGEKALQILDNKKMRFDLVLVDILMPGMDGKTFIGHMRQNKHPLRANLPVFALTGLTDPKEVEKIKELGVHAVLTKPVSQNSLRTALQILMPNDKQVKEPLTVDTIVSNLDKFSDNDKQKLLSALKTATHEEEPVIVQQPVRSFEKPLVAVEQEEIVEPPKPKYVPQPVPVAEAPKQEAPSSTTLNLTMLNDLRGALPKETLDEIFKELIDKSKELTTLIEEAMAAEDMEDLAEKAHNLKGMAGNFGLQMLMNHAGVLEKCGRQNDNEKAAKHVPLGRQILKDTLSELDAWIKAA